MRRFLLLCLIAFLAGEGCTHREVEMTSAKSSPTPPAISEPTSPTAEDEKSVEEIIREQRLEKPKQRSLLRTLRSIPNHRDYRAVRRSDIKIPKWVRQEYYWSDVERGIGWASDYGEMSGAYGLIVFIVDKRIADVNRFSVVVFIERPGNRYTVHWIKRNEDLSSVLLGRHSGNVYLKQYLDGGRSLFCDVQWNSATRKWGCELKEG